MSAPEETDERLGLPSASAIERIENCPGSHKRSKGFPRKPNPWAAIGDRVHAWLEHQDINRTQGMDYAEIDIAERCMEQTAELEDAWFGPNKSGRQVAIEMRLGIDAATQAAMVTPVTRPPNLVFTGKGDRFIIGADSALIVDYKSGRAKYAHASENRQLRALAVMLYLFTGISRIRVAIVQPWTGRPTVADFNVVTLEQGITWLERVLSAEREANPETDIHAGHWCHYCPAFEGCPAAQNLALAGVDSLTAGGAETPSKEAIMARAFELSPTALAGALRGLQMVGWYVEAIKYAAMRRIQDGENIPGFAINVSKPKETITNPSLVFSRLQAIGVTGDEFAGIVGVGKGKLEDLIRAKTGKKGKGLGEALAATIAGATEFGASSKSIVAVSASETDAVEIS